MKWIAADSRGGIGEHLFWIIAAASLGFLISFGAVTTASLPRSWFVAVHIAISGILLVLYAQRTGFGLAELRRNWFLGMLTGTLAALMTVNFVLSQPRSSGPEGVELVWNTIWLGVGYGLVDALLLSVLPVWSVWCIARRLNWLDNAFGWIGAAIAALAASILVTTTYHLGFPEFQGALIVQPLIGNTIFTIAYILSASPLAPVLSHMAMHITAVLFTFSTSIPLPPHY